MKDREEVSLLQEVRNAEKKAQAARLRLWEKRGPDGWRRLGMLFSALALGYTFALSIWLFLDDLDFARSFGRGFPWMSLLMLAIGPAALLFLRFSPQLRPMMRHFNWELMLGFVAGLVLTLLFLVPRI